MTFRDKTPTIRDSIFACISDMSSKLLYYDRKEDEDLPVGAIERLIRDGEITIEEIVKTFEDDFRSDVARLNKNKP